MNRAQSDQARTVTTVEITQTGKPRAAETRPAYSALIVSMTASWDAFVQEQDVTVAEAEDVRKAEAAAQRVFEMYPNAIRQLAE